MTQSDLERASDRLERAAAAADGERADRLRDQAATMEKLSKADRGPDHGRLARHEQKLRSIAEGADERVVAEVDDALAAISSFRETVDGV